MNIIDNYRDLPLGTYLGILARIEAEGGDELAAQVATIAALCGTEEAEVYALPLEEYKRLAAAAAFLKEPCPDDLVRIADKYPCGEFTLVPVKDYAKLTVAQYVDFQAYARDAEHQLPGLLTALLVPEGKEYAEGYDVAKVRDAICRDLNVADALGLAAHFFAYASRSIASTLTYSRKLARRMKAGPEKTALLTRTAELARLLQSAGDGSR